MFSDAEFYSQHHSLQVVDVHKLLDWVLPKMSFGEEDVIMDVGCGSGDNTRDVLLPRIPKLKKLVGIDLSSEMIEFARTHKDSEKLEYHVADIENMSSLKEWEGTISKIFSVDCFHWLKNQKKGFQSMHCLLKPKAEAALLFVVSAVVWDCFASLINDIKWNKYLKDVDTYIPDSHYLNLGEEYYREILEDLGFEVLLCFVENRTYAFANDAEAKATMKPCTALTSYIPDEEMEEFMDQYFNIFLKLSGRNSYGQPLFPFTDLTIHVRKP